MDYLKVHGEDFRKLIDERSISAVVCGTQSVLVATIQKYGVENVVFLVMANGANWFAQRLFECFGTQSLHIEYAQLVSYSGSNQTELKLVSMPQKTDVENKVVVIVEDIIDSGKTIDFVKNWLVENGVSTVEIHALCIREGNKTVTANEPLIVAVGEWLVGCGMDYFHEGRNLNCIYTKVK